ncbi:MAG TPA: penicillin acylase family protein, partial [Thermoanaerobaculia bacterium]
LAQGTDLTATIHRDAWGAPHVSAETDRGVLYGMAWALAEDDWPLIEANYLNALGRSAEAKGEAGVRDDWMAHAFGIVPLSVREYENATPRMRGLLDAYAAGMNAWLATGAAGAPGSSAARVLARIEPWYPLALIRYKYYQNEFLGYAGLSGRWAQRLRLEGLAAGPRADAARAIEPLAWHHVAPEDARYAEAQVDRDGVRPRGSNQWALAPSRTASGAAMLLINPHQSFVGVQRYAEIHLDSREGLRFSGLTVFGFLLPYMGNSDRLGWAYTDNYADHSDLYAETLDDAASATPRYRHGDEWRALETRVDTIRVRSDDGSLESREFRFWRTHHGPIVGVHDDGRPLAARLARYEEGGWYDQWDAMIRARSLDEWRAAMSLLHVAYMNAMYADADGNIGYVYGSAIPRRLDGIDPSGVLDGADPRTEWQGFHAFEELPQIYNPSNGWLLNTNSSPFVAAPDLPFERDDFPAYMVGSETDNARAVSSRRVLASLERATLDDFARAAWNSRLSVADSIIEALLTERLVRATDRSAEPALDRAIDRLEAWDRVADTASVETTWFVLMLERVGAMRASGAGLPWISTLRDVLRMLEDDRGSALVPWGALNRHQRPLPGAAWALDTTRASLAVGGAPGGLGSIFTFNAPGNGRPEPRLGRSGNSFVKVVEFGDTVRARSILNYGQSGDPASPHFFDQAALYARREFKPAWFDRAEVEANAARTYVVP